MVGDTEEGAADIHASDAAPPPPSAPAVSRLSAVAAALFSPTVVWVAAANNIILRNLTDLSYRVETVWIFAAGFVLSFGLCAIVFLRARTSAAWRGVARTILLLGACVLLFDGVAALLLGRVHQAGALIAIDAALVLVAGCVMFRAPYPALTAAAGLGGVLLLLHGTATHALTVGRYRRLHDVRVSTQRLQRLPPGQRRRNVYHIVLDGFQREAFALLADRHPEFRFAGFTFYRRFITNYAYTSYALPSLLGGRLHTTAASFDTWQAEGLQAGVWGEMAAARMQLSLYPYFPGYCFQPYATGETLVVCRDAISLAEYSPTRLTVDLWFLGLLPVSLRSVYAVGPAPRTDATTVFAPPSPRRFSLTRALGRGAETAGPDRHRAFATLSVPNFDRMLREEASRPAHGQYVFVHAVLPHAPYVVDCRCEPRDATGIPTADAYLAQAECGLRLVGRLVDRLKMLDRFDDAVILVHADHGVWPEPGRPFRTALAEYLPPPDRNPPDVVGEGNPLRVSAEAVTLRSGALLLAKFPGATEFAVSDAPAQMVDIAPTILSVAGLPASGYPGIPLYRLTEDDAREAVFFTGDKDPYAPRPRGNAFTKFVRVGDRWSNRGLVPLTP